MTESGTHGEHRTGEFTARDGTVLFEQAWTVASPKACVVIVHGYGEHSSRYAHVAERFNAEGFSVYTYDQRNHGKSPGKKGFIPSFDPMVDDLDGFLSEVRTRSGGVPIIMFGHSMGGLVLALFAIKFSPEVRGLVFSSAGVKVDDSVAPMMRKIGGLLARILPHL